MSSYRISPLKTRLRPDFGKGGVYLVALIAIAPVLAIPWLAFSPSENIWAHLISTALPRYFANTIWLMLGTGISVFLTGVSTAYLVTTFEFPFRRYFEWLLLLPLAFPAYVVAYLYTDLLEFSGPVQTVLREIFSWRLASEYWFPEIRSIGGAILMMGLVLYPYVYLMARTSFLEQSSYLIDASRLMGRSHFGAFWFVSLPIARPAVAVGVALALMETLNDFGTVDFFAVHTLTAGLYDVWLNMGNLGGAAQIASVMLTFVLVLLLFEYLGRRRRRFYQHSSRFKTRSLVQLTGSAKWLAVFVCAAPVVVGFFIPFVLLFDYAMTYFDRAWDADLKTYAINSLLVSSMAAVISALVAVMICHVGRGRGGAMVKLATRLSSIGYAIPGAVLAVGVIIPLAGIDNQVDAFFRAHMGFSSGLLLSGSIFALVLTYVIRFLAVSIGSVESSFSKVSESIDMASRTLGHSPWKTLIHYHLPLIRGGVLTAALIVFVDCMKELPATLLLRPFNFETLATHVYLFASDEMLGHSAPGALLIVFSGLIPVVILSKTISTSQELPVVDSDGLTSGREEPRQINETR